MALPYGSPRSLKRLWAFLEKREAAISELSAISTADATDATSAAALANATKAKINAIITALKA